MTLNPRGYLRPREVNRRDRGFLQTPLDVQVEWAWMCS